MTVQYPEDPAAPDVTAYAESLIDGSLDEAGRRRLETVLLASPEARQSFRSALYFHQQIRAELQLAQGMNLFDVPPNPGRRWTVAIALLVSLSVLAGLGLFMAGRDSAAPKPATFGVYPPHK